MVYLAIFVFMTLTPTEAFGYLDPSSGNALVYFILGIIGGTAFFFKSIFYRFFGGKGSKENTKKKIVIFSEGRVYEKTFRPIIDGFLKLGQEFEYLTCDLEDPNFAIDHKLMKTRYIGQGTMAYLKVAKLDAALLITTTPNIGTKGYPLTRPKKVQCMAHVFHHIGTVGTYHKHSLDAYDAVLMIGDFQEQAIRQLELKRMIPQKECVAVGLPYFDSLKEMLALKSTNREPSQQLTKLTILVAPSWGKKSFVNQAGTDFMHKILDHGHNLIFRPHPFSWNRERKYLTTLKSEFSARAGFIIDDNIDSTASMSRADVLISDVSGVRFDFAFLFLKPVVSVRVDASSLLEFEFADLDQNWEDHAGKRIGIEIHAKDLSQIQEYLSEAHKLKPELIREFQDETLCCIGSSGLNIAKWSIHKASNPKQVSQ